MTLVIRAAQYSKTRYDYKSRAYGYTFPRQKHYGPHLAPMKTLLVSASGLLSESYEIGE